VSERPGTGLASNHQTSTNTHRTKPDTAEHESATIDERPSGTGCPNRRGLVWLNLLTGESAPMRCGRLACSYCALRNAWRRSMAISLAAPQRAILLTLLAPAGDPDPWPTVRRTYNRTREWLVRAGVDPGEMVLHVEPNPQATGYHGHVWQHGPKIPKEALQEAAHHAGAGWSSINRVRSAVGVSAYGLKGMSYGLKGIGADDSTATYLRCNGNRLTHQSSGFFRSELGVRLPVKGAERRALTLAIGESEGTWTLATESGAASYRLVKPGSAMAGRASAIRPAGSNPAGSTAVA
jgi:hypothetical protein